ncbi:serine-threonine protein kinase [Anaeramoeba flamelloides]|uniref:Serine-threonine protein kinase n=1 Tax=Anaeramoeba flamelloides TaxID=1746091 RepID=A0ABQ8XAR2_9EUKA|nr:serine-threonine protein kinase [Anaeramoeba flamelloides]
MNNDLHSIVDREIMTKVSKFMNTFEDFQKQKQEQEQEQKQKQKQKKENENETENENENKNQNEGSVDIENTFNDLKLLFSKIKNEETKVQKTVLYGLVDRVIGFERENYNYERIKTTLEENLKTYKQFEQLKTLYQESFPKTETKEKWYEASCSKDDFSLGTLTERRTFTEHYVTEIGDESATVMIRKLNGFEPNEDQKKSIKNISKIPSHPNIYRTLGYHAKKKIILSEFEKGSLPLMQAIKNFNLRSGTVLRILIDIIEAILYLRRCGINIASLQIGNIFVNKSVVAKLLFQFHCEIDPYNFGTNLDISFKDGDNGMVNSMLKWTSIEVVEHSHIQTLHSLSYSLSMILYEIIYQRHPFESIDPNELRKLIVNKNWRPKLIFDNTIYSKTINVIIQKSWSNIAKERLSLEENLSLIQELLRKITDLKLEIKEKQSRDKAKKQKKNNKRNNKKKSKKDKKEEEEENFFNIIFERIKEIKTNENLNSKNKKKSENMINELLIESVKKRDISSVRYLIDTGVSTNIISTQENHYTPLHITVEKQDSEIMTLLLCNGAKVNKKNKGRWNWRGKSPLAMAKNNSNGTKSSSKDNDLIIKLLQNASKDKIPLLRPKNIQITFLTENSIEVVWEPMKNSLKYELSLGSQRNSPTVTSNRNRCVFTGINVRKNGIQFVRIRGIDLKEIPGEWSETVVLVIPHKLECIDWSGNSYQNNNNNNDNDKNNNNIKKKKKKKKNKNKKKTTTMKMKERKNKKWKVGKPIWFILESYYNKKKIYCGGCKSLIKFEIILIQKIKINNKIKIKKESINNGIIIDKRNGSYLLHFIPEKSGKYQIRAIFGNDNDDNLIKFNNCTDWFEIQVDTGKLTIDKCLLIGDGFSSTKPLITDNDYQCIFHSCDNRGNKIDSKTDNLDFKVFIKSSNLKIIKNTVINNHDGSFTISYHPYFAGTLFFNITINSQTKTWITKAISTNYFNINNLIPYINQFNNYNNNNNNDMDYNNHTKHAFYNKFELMEIEHNNNNNNNNNNNGKQKDNKNYQEKNNFQNLINYYTKIKKKYFNFVHNNHQLFIKIYNNLNYLKILKLKRYFNDLCLISHPNIVNLIGFRIFNNNGFIITEYLNKNLKNNYLQYDDKEIFNKKLHFLLDIARGLEYLHSNSIIHGNLSPKQILIDQNERAKLSLINNLQNKKSSYYLRLNNNDQIIEKKHDVSAFGLLMRKILFNTDPEINNFNYDLIDFNFNTKNSGNNNGTRIKKKNKNGNNTLIILIKNCIRENLNINNNDNNSNNNGNNDDNNDNKSNNTNNKMNNNYQKIDFHFIVSTLKYIISNNFHKLNFEDLFSNIKNEFIQPVYHNNMINSFKVTLKRNIFEIGRNLNNEIFQFIENNFLNFIGQTKEFIRIDTIDLIYNPDLITKYYYGRKLLENLIDLKKNGKNVFKYYKNFEKNNQEIKINNIGKKWLESLHALTHNFHKNKKDHPILAWTFLPKNQLNNLFQCNNELNYQSMEFSTYNGFGNFLINDNNFINKFKPVLCWISIGNPFAFNSYNSNCPLKFDSNYYCLTTSSKKNQSNIKINNIPNNTNSNINMSINNLDDISMKNEKVEKKKKKDKSKQKEQEEIEKIKNEILTELNNNNKTENNTNANFIDRNAFVPQNKNSELIIGDLFEIFNMNLILPQFIINFLKLELNLIVIPKINSVKLYLQFKDLTNQLIIPEDEVNKYGPFYFQIKLDWFQDNNENSLLFSGCGINYLIKDLKNGVNYKVCCKIKNGNIWTLWSDWIEFQTLLPSIPKKIDINLIQVLNLTPSSFNINWNLMDDHEFEIDFFELNYEINTNTPKLIQVQKKNYQFRNLSPMTTIIFRIRSHNIFGFSNWSENVKVITPEGPSHKFSYIINESNEKIFKFKADETIKLQLQLVSKLNINLNKGGCESIINFMLKYIKVKEEKEKDTLQGNNKEQEEEHSDDDDEQRIITQGQLIDLNNGKYNLLAKCPIVGKWEILLSIANNQFLNNSQPLPIIEIIPGIFSLQRSEIKGEQLNTTFINKETIFKIISKDYLDNYIHEGGMIIQARFIEMDVPIKIIDQSNGIYLCKYTAAQSGQYTIELTVPSENKTILTRLIRVRILPTNTQINESEIQNIELLKKKNENIQIQIEKAFWGGRSIIIKRVNQENFKIFQSEISTLSIMNHPNIVKLLGMFESDKNGRKEYCIVTEYIKGYNLREYLENEKFESQQSIKDKLLIVKQIVYALCYLHESGIIHRNLKPTNIFLDEDLNIKITDFGFSKNFQIGDKSASLTENTNLIGTLEYLAPETKKFNKYSEKTDVYTFGTILYQLLTGERPIETLISSVKLSPQIPKKVRDMLILCLNDDKKLRPNFFTIKDTINTVINQSQLYYTLDINGLLSSKLGLDSIEIITNQDKKQVARLFHLNPIIKNNSIASVLFLKIKNYFVNFIQNKSNISNENININNNNIFLIQNENNKIISKYKINSITLIENAHLSEKFELQRQILLNNYKQNDQDFISYYQQFYPQNRLSIQYLENLKKIGNDLPENPLICYQLINKDLIYQIAKNGFKNIKFNYLSHSFKFATKNVFNINNKYKNNKLKKKENLKLLVCWVLLGNPYPLTLVNNYSNPKENFDSHYTPLKFKKKSKNLFKNTKDYRPSPSKSYYPIDINEIDQIDADEITIFDHERILPLAIIDYHFN